MQNPQGQIIAGGARVTDDTGHIGTVTATGTAITDTHEVRTATVVWDHLLSAVPTTYTTDTLRPLATHRLQGVPVHSLRPTTSPWTDDTAPWSRATRVDNGVDVIAPTYFFVG